MAELFFDRMKGLKKLNEELAEIFPEAILDVYKEAKKEKKPVNVQRRVSM